MERKHTGRLTLPLKRVYKAPLEVVWRAWIAPGELGKWLAQWRRLDSGEGQPRHSFGRVTFADDAGGPNVYNW
jgi:uncharacterized protein YndB with AHSA1/START domain